MFYDYEFKHYNIRLILYMTALNILGILVIRSATNWRLGCPWWTTTGF